MVSVQWVSLLKHLSGSDHSGRLGPPLQESTGVEEKPGSSLWAGQSCQAPFPAPRSQRQLKPLLLSLPVASEMLLWAPQALNSINPNVRVYIQAQL